MQIEKRDLIDENRDLIDLQLRVLRCQAGDAKAFVGLYREFAPRTRRFIRAMIGAAESEDAQQELWTAVFESINSLSHPSAFVTWLFRMARFKAVDRLRRVRTDHATTVFGADSEIESTVTLEQAIGDRIDVGRALARLSPSHRQTVLLRHWEDLSYTQIAMVTDCPVGTVRSRLHHAHRIMREALDHTLETP